MTLIVFTSTYTKEETAHIASYLIENKLCACAHIDAIETCFYWDGAVQNKTEYRAMLKCSDDAYEAVEAAILDLHPFDEPPIYATAIVKGTDSYLSWIAENSKKITT